MAHPTVRRRFARLSQPATSDAWRYAIAILLVAAALIVRFSLRELLGQKVPYLQFYPAIVLASWYGGLGPGLVATTLSALAAMVWLLPPDGPAVTDIADLLSLAIFAGTGVSIAWLSHRLHASEGAHASAAALATARAERLDAIINTTVDGIIVIDSQGRLEAFNRGAERLFRYPASEVIGRNVTMLMPSPYHEEHDSYLQRYLATGHAKIIGSSREVQGRRRDGAVFPLHLSVGEMRVGGEPKFTGMLHDLSARKGLEDQLRSSEARWRAIVESAVDAIVVIDAHGRIEAFNPAAKRLFGYEPQSVVGQNVDMLMPSPYHEEHDSYLSRYLATGRAKIIGIGREVTGRRKDGSTFPLHLSVGQVTLGGEPKFTGILHDLSARVRMEEVMREQASLARLGEMAAVIAHEVKNPLAGVRGAIQIIGQRLPAGNTDGPIVREIIKRIDALDGMMKDLLLFARPPKPQYAPTDLGLLIASTADLLTKDESLVDIEVAIDGSAPPFPADAEMLKIVFHNLLVNAAHAMHGHGRIRVAVKVADAACNVAFIDQGPGIPADMRTKVFTPFFTTKTRGSGLGLPTAKRLIEAHNGEISLDCPPAGGTIVHIRLPLERPLQVSA